MSERVICGTCGKEIKIKNYKGQIAPYICSKDRNTTHKLDRCPDIDKSNFIQMNGFKRFYCKKIKNFVVISICKNCTEEK